MTPAPVPAIQAAVRAAAGGDPPLRGWLFSNFHHRDLLADETLGLDPGATNTRLWLYAVPGEGAPRKIVHAVESRILDSLPGDAALYISRDDLARALASLRDDLGAGAWAVNMSENILAVSYLDAGTAAFLEKAGLRLVSAASLVQRLRGLLDAEGIASHERAAVHLYEIVRLAWGLVRERLGSGTLREGDIRALMLDEMDRRGLTPDHAPIVAAGVNSGNPHYDFAGSGELIREGDLLQFDLWARERRPGAIFADISWMGVCAGRPSREAERAFADILAAREGALGFIREELAAGRPVSGAQVDRKARDILIARGREGELKHRTGHGIDTELHGSGVNMDAVEFPDDRLLLEGSCFSLEPGIYTPQGGMRTEIDVYIKDAQPVVSGRPHDRQVSLLTL